MLLLIIFYHILYVENFYFYMRLYSVLHSTWSSVSDYALDSPFGVQEARFSEWVRVREH
jgi:hypothetical protein